MTSNSTSFTRRQLLQGAGALLAHSAVASNVGGPGPRGTDAVAQTSAVPRNDNVEYGQNTLAIGIRSRIIENNNGVKMHILEACFEERERP